MVNDVSPQAKGRWCEEGKRFNEWPELLKRVLFRLVDDNALPYLSTRHFLYSSGTVSCRIQLPSLMDYLRPHSLTRIILPEAMHITPPRDAACSHRMQPTTQLKTSLTKYLVAVDAIFPYIVCAVYTAGSYDC